MADAVATSVVCRLCGLDCDRAPLTQVFEGEPCTFCCAGCLNVYAILLEGGFVKPGVSLRDTALFKRSLALGLVAAGPQPAARPDAARIPPGAPTQEVLYQLSGLWCVSCGWLIEHALTRERGVISAEVYFASDLVKVRYCPQLIPPDRIPARIVSLGYGASEYAGESESAIAEGRDLLLRLGVAVFLWVNVMMLNAAIYVGYFEQTPESIRRLLPWVLMSLTAPAVAYSARPVLRLAWTGLRLGVMRMETLLALGIVAAFAYSAIETLRGGDRIYFDTVCAIIALVLVGKNVERAAKSRTSRAIALLYRLMPKKARVLAGGQERFVSIDALRPGGVFLVKTGERIPADGTVVDGESHVDESVLTGEAAPVAKGPGREVVCGSLTLSGILRVRATRVGAESTLAQIVSLVEQALGRRSAIEQTADRVSRVFVPGAIVIAASTWAGWWLIGQASIGDALMRGITVLVIACPCALGIATPLAVTAAIGTASRRGILVTDSRVLETTRRIDTVLLDKTGTVTTGDFALLEAPDRDLAIVAALEAYSEHPLGRAVVAGARERGLDVPEATDVEILKGQGIRGRVQGRLVAVGSRRLAPPGGELARRADDFARRGHSVAFYGVNGDTRGLLVFGDRVRDDAAGLVRTLKQRHIRVIVVSGDSRATTAWVAARIGADGHRAEVLPSEKADVVTALQRDGRVVAMIGDGVNDAPALAAADLGIAVGSGTDLAMRASSVVLMHPSLERVIEVFDLSRRTLRIVRQNLFWAFFYNTLGISLAVMGMLNPIVAAAGMVLSSLSVIANSSRLTQPPARPTRGAPDPASAHEADESRHA